MQWLNSLIAGLIAIYLFFFPLWLFFAYKYGRQQPKRGTLISIIILLIAGGLSLFLEHILNLVLMDLKGVEVGFCLLQE